MAQRAPSEGQVLMQGGLFQSAATAHYAPREKMRIAYADPPYIGCARMHYKDHPDFAGEVDHLQLIQKLHSEFPDGWALSCSSPTLRELLNICASVGADDVRVAAWVKPWAVWKPGMSVAYAWEPVIWRGGRKKNKKEHTSRDWVSANAVMRRRNDPNQTKGTKPLEFCCWLFDLFNMRPEDELVDLFAGSGAVVEAWEWWKRQGRLPLGV